jgi:apolipoprotein N-acyltransferase
LETWRAQTPYDVNRDALRQARETEEARVRRELLKQRRALWFVWIIGIAMAVWAGFWIAITITNGWPAIYAIASGVSLVVFALGVGAFWMSRARPRELDRNFGNSLQEEARRSLALVDYQLSITSRLIFSLLGMVFIVVGVGLFSWTLTRSQNIPTGSSFGGWNLFTLVFVALAIRELYRGRDARRTRKLKLEARQRHLRELLAALDARE